MVVNCLKIWFLAAFFSLCLSAFFSGFFGFLVWCTQRPEDGKRQEKARKRQENGTKKAGKRQEKSRGKGREDGHKNGHIEALKKPQFNS